MNDEGERRKVEAKGAVSARFTRRRMLQGILACGLALSGCAPARAAAVRHALNLPAATDLQRDGEASTQAGVPVLLFFDRGDCPYCERALREFLVPMARGEEWGARAVYRQIEIDEVTPVVDFAGATTTHRDFARRHEVRFTPTIILVDAKGEPLTPPLVGLSTPDFYAAYLEAAIDAATARLRPAAKA